MGSVSDRAASVARARQTFLTSGELMGADVREVILSSWRRSRFWGVAVDQVDLPYKGEGDVDSRLVHASQPVLNRLERELADTKMSVILTDSQAWVLDRRAGERSLNGYLDRVLLAPGFSYAEKFIGTNGLGTALEEKRASHVFGHEHFIDRLQMLSCAGAPIRDPISGKVLGVIDVTCWRSDASLLMSVLVQEAARDVEARLFEQSGDRERALLREFLSACRRTRKPVLSLSGDLTITNVSATHLLDHDDYAIVREKAMELAGSPRETTGEVLLSGGQLVRLLCPAAAPPGPGPATRSTRTRAGARGCCWSASPASARSRWPGRRTGGSCRGRRCRSSTPPTSRTGRPASGWPTCGCSSAIPAGRWCSPTWSG